MSFNLRSYLFLGIFIHLPLTLNAQAHVSKETLYDRLKDSALSFEETGAVCEQVERINLESEYPPPRYQIFTGVALKDPYSGEEMGEMDVVVKDLLADTIVFVGEVKCWKDKSLYSAAKKARHQLSLLFINLNSIEPVSIYLRSDPTVTFDQAQFLKLARTDFQSIAQNGGERFGFKRTLGHSWTTLMNLRQDLIDCQKRGECPSPALHISKSKKRRERSQTWPKYERPVRFPWNWFHRDIPTP